MKRDLIPYAGKPVARAGRWTRGQPVCFRKAKFEQQGDNLYSIGARESALSDEQGEKVLALFRSGQDTVWIAAHFECTPAAAANALDRARDKERAA